jgi:hypothetical protein
MRQRKWLLVAAGLGLALLVVILAVALYPAAGLAQPAGRGNGDAAQQAPDVGATRAGAGWQTDDPLGRAPVVPPEAGPRNNVAAQEAAGTPLGPTDDPLGRVIIPVAGEMDPGVNGTQP